LALLFVAGFLDASFIPFPVTTIFVVLSLNRSSNLTPFSIIVVSGTLLGATAGFLAGRYLWTDQAGEFTWFALFCFRTIPGFSIENYARLSDLYNAWGIGIIIFASFTAFPFGLISVSAGLFKLSAMLFLLATLIGQSAKYLLVAFLCQRYGIQLLKMLRFNWKPWLVSAAILLAALAFFIKLVP